MMCYCVTCSESAAPLHKKISVNKLLCVVCLFYSSK
jgi:hypothetical protein